MKIAVFSGLAHHVEKLLPLLERATALGDEVVLLSADNPYAPLSADFEAMARGSSYPCRMLSEWRSSRPLLEAAWTQRRECFKVWESAFRRGQFDPSIIVSSRLSYAVQESCEIGLWAEAAFSDICPDVLVILHQRNFWTRLLAAQAMRMRIPVVSFQEGLFYDLWAKEAFVNLAALGDRVLLWGQGDVDRLVDAGHDPTRLRAVGAMHLERVRQRRREESRESLRAALGLWSSGKILLVIPPAASIGGIGREEWLSLIDFVRTREEMRLAVKWRPLDAEGEFSALATSVLGDRFASFTVGNPYDLVIAADAVLGHSTSLMAESVALEVPVIQLRFKEPEREIIRIAEDACLPRIGGALDFSSLDRWLSDGFPIESIEGAARYRSRRFATGETAPSQLAYDQLAQVVESRALR